jgi:hypothetical protein
MKIYFKLFAAIHATVAIIIIDVSLQSNEMDVKKVPIF